MTWAAACGGDGGTDPGPAPQQPNRPPAAQGSIPAQTLTVGESTTVNVAAVFSDPDGDALTFTAISANPGVASVSLSGGNLTITAVSAGSATVTVTARDPAGLSTASSANVTVTEPNRAPVATTPVAPALTAVVGDTVRVNVTPFFSDPDGDALTFSAESGSPSIVTASVAGSVVSGVAVGVGSAALTVTATDPEGLFASISVPVTVAANEPPVTTRTSLPATSIQVRDSAVVNLAPFFRDPNGQALTYTAESSNAGVATVSVADNVMTVRAVAPGAATVTVTATDPAGLAVSLSGDVTVTERVNRAPEVVGTISATTATVGWTGGLELEGARPVFVDPDGDALTYSAESSNPSVATATVTGTRLTVSMEAVGTAVATVTATDPEGLSASLSFDLIVLPAASSVFRDDFNDSTSIADWQIQGATAEVSDGVLRLTAASDSVWGIAARGLDAPITSWEARVRVGREADTVTTALLFVVDDPGELDTQVFRLLVGTRVLDFGGGDVETINYGLQVYFTPEGRDEGWYFIGAEDIDFRGVSSAINDGPGEFTDITVKVQDGRFETIAGADTLFSVVAGRLSFGDAIPVITEVHLWTLDETVTHPSLFDWIEVDGVPTGGGSASAVGRFRSRGVVPLDAMTGGGEVREAAGLEVGGEPARSSLTPGRR